MSYKNGNFANDPLRSSFEISLCLSLLILIIFFRFYALINTYFYLCHGSENSGFSVWLDQFLFVDWWLQGSRSKCFQKGCKIQRQYNFLPLYVSHLSCNSVTPFLALQQCKFCNFFKVFRLCKFFTISNVFLVWFYHEFLNRTEYGEIRSIRI